MDRNPAVLYKTLVVGVIILFIGLGVQPTIAIDNPILQIRFGKTLYVGGTEPGNYTKIQDAINNASDGDTVFVYSGTYYENIIINNSICLNGEDKNTTVIDGGGNGDVVTVTADWVNISGFTVQNSGDWRTEAGFDLISNHNRIKDNIISNNGDGIELHESSENSISKNIISLNEEGGIDIDKSNYNIFMMNNIFQNKYYGILVFNSNSNIITNNEIYENKLHGINIQNGSNNRIICNKIYGHKSISNVWGIFTFKENSCNIISENTISDNWGAIDYMGVNSMISNNKIINNTNYGIFLDSPGWLPCKNNTITNNNIQNNEEYGLILNSANHNIIESNNFIGNKIQASFIFSKKNNWDKNYWDDWIGTKIKLPIFQKFPKIIFGRGILILIPSFNFDWHPAKEPYYI
jgi:parallel beta-helix repeat protein